MQLDGLHHITMITPHAQTCLDFHGGVMGLRLVKQTVNFDAPDMYHLYFGDDAGSPGSLLTWFEIRGARVGRAGAGMIHRINLGVPTSESLEWWRSHLASAGRSCELIADELHFTDPDGLAFAIVVDPGVNPPLPASSPTIPAEHAITGVVGIRAFGDPSDDEALLLGTWGFTQGSSTGTYDLAGATRTVGWAYDTPPAEPGIQGGGTVHHIAWCSEDADHLAWRQRGIDSGLQVTTVQDRDYFEAIYSRMPGGVLFEFATKSPGFATDEVAAHLGEELRVPKMHEHITAQIHEMLVPLELPWRPVGAETAG